MVALNGSSRLGITESITMLGPDFPFAYDEWLSSAHGLGEIPEAEFGSPVAVIGAGMSGLVAAYELMRMGLRPTVYEAGQVGGRMRSASFDAEPEAVAELGAMRFPASATALRHYLDLVGLTTRPFPNPLAPASGSTVVDLERRAALRRALRRTCRHVPGSRHGLGQDAPGARRAVRHGRRDPPPGHRGHQGDLEPARPRPRRPVLLRLPRELAGLPVVQVPRDLRPGRLRRGRLGHRLPQLHAGDPAGRLHRRRGRPPARRRRLPAAAAAPLVPRARPTSRTGPRAPPWSPCTTAAARGAAARVERTARGIVVHEQDGTARAFPAAVYTPHKRTLVTNVRCDRALLPTPVWTAVERSHYMGSSKLFVLVDRPFWRERDPRTGREVMSTTLTDRMPRGVYLFDEGPDRPAVMCLSYTWNDDSLKMGPLTPEERLDGVPGRARRHLPRRGRPLPRHRAAAHGDLGERPSFPGGVQGEPAGPLPLPAAAVHPLHAAGPDRGGSAGSSSPATMSPGRRASPRARSPRASTPCGACSATSAAPPCRSTRVPATGSPSWPRSNCPRTERTRGHDGERAPERTTLRSPSHVAVRASALRSVRAAGSRGCRWRRRDRWSRRARST